MEIKRTKQLESWLRNKPREWSTVIAARTALRAAPLLAGAIGSRGGSASITARDLVLPIFRAIALSWFAAEWPSRRKDLPAAVTRAGARTAGLAGGVAGSAAYAAYAAYTAAAAAATDDAAAAADYAAAAADYAGTAAGDALWAAISADATELERENGFSPHVLAMQEVWPTAAPVWAESHWRQLKAAPLSLDEDWEVWTDWYEARLTAGPSNEELEIARVMIDDGIWEQGPKVVNARIKELIAGDEGASTARVSESWDFFLSYSNGDEAYARWIGRLLRLAGIRVFAQFNNISPGNNFVREMQRGLSRSSRFIALLSPRYEHSDHCQAEWSAAYNSDPSGAARKMIPFLIQACELGPLARQIVYKSLVGLSPADVAVEILRSVDYAGPKITAPLGWPGSLAVDKMQAASGGVFEIGPDESGLLTRRSTTIPNPASDVFSAEQLYADLARQVAEFFEYTKRSKGNASCSARLKERAAKLHLSVSSDLSNCDPLALNKNLVWVLRTLALDKADGVIPANDDLEHYAGDLYGQYNWLEHIFPKLKIYRNMDARNRFEEPSPDVEKAITFVYSIFGNPAISQGALSSNLSQQLKEAGEGILDAKTVPASASANKALDVTIESHAEGAARSLAVWSWLANSREKLESAGRRVNEIEKTIENYEKLYNRVSPHMATYVSYLLKWFF